MVFIFLMFAIDLFNHRHHHHHRHHRHHHYFKSILNSGEDAAHQAKKKRCTPRLIGTIIFVIGNIFNFAAFGFAAQSLLGIINSLIIFLVEKLKSMNIVTLKKLKENFKNRNK